KKMKTILRLSALALITLLSMNVSAQSVTRVAGAVASPTDGSGSGSGSTTLTVNVAELYSIVIDENASISLNDQDDFLNGAKSSVTNLTVFASKGYKIAATASADHFTSNAAEAGNTPLVNNVDILVSRNGESSDVNSTPLTKGGGIVFNSLSGEKNSEFDAQYHIPAENTEAFLTSGGQTLETVITYTITGN